MTTRSLTLAALLAGLTSTAWSEAARPDDDSTGSKTQSVIAGRKEYDKPGYYKFHFGEGYRKLWTTPFVEPVLDLKTFAGGLTAVRQVGSMQSLGLALKGQDGKNYTFRTFDKDPTKILPPEWRESAPAGIFQDQTTASHPAAALIVPVLAEAARVPHTNPIAVFMPDDPALGEFRATFGGKPGLIDEGGIGQLGKGVKGLPRLVALFVRRRPCRQSAALVAFGPLLVPPGIVEG
jgi:hypothetical protein